MCADCDIPLVAELPVEPVPESVQQTSQSTLVPVFETYNQHDIAIIKSTLDAEGIIYHFSGETIPDRTYHYPSLDILNPRIGSKKGTQYRLDTRFSQVGIIFRMGNKKTPA